MRIRRAGPARLGRRFNATSGCRRRVWNSTRPHRDTCRGRFRASWWDEPYCGNRASRADRRRSDQEQGKEGYGRHRTMSLDSYSTRSCRRNFTYFEKDWKNLALNMVIQTIIRSVQVALDLYPNFNSCSWRFNGGRGRRGNRSCPMQNLQVRVYLIVLLRCELMI